MMNTNQYTKVQYIQLIHSGANYFETLIQLIQNSKQSIYLQTYIFASDETGMQVISALKMAASRRIKVFVLIDAFGSYSYRAELTKAMQHSGIHFRFFSPLFSRESILPWRRLHHKVLLCDQHKTLLGGINIANKYNTLPGQTPWLDYAVLIEGEALALQQYCESLHLKKNKRRNLVSIDTIPIKASEVQVRYRKNDWFKRKNEIHKSYVEAIKRAKKSMIIVAAYFLPGAHFRKLLKEASLRGVSIRILVAGKSDSFSVKLAEQYLYDFYLRQHIDVFEWKNSILHGKLILIDDAWVSIGSYNLNFLSHYISVELNADIISPNFVSELSQHLDSITRNASATNKLEPAFKRSLMKQFQMWLAYNFFRWMMTIFVSEKIKHKK